MPGKYIKVFCFQQSELTHCIVRHADGTVHVCLKVLEPASEHGQLVHVTFQLSHKHRGSGDTPPASPACPDAKSDGIAPATNHAKMHAVQCQPAAPSTAQKAVSEPQPQASAEEVVSQCTINKPHQQAGALVMSELPMVVSRAPPDSPPPDKQSVRKGLGGTLSHLTSMSPLPWPLPSWHLNPKSVATSLLPAAADAHSPADSLHSPERNQTDGSSQLHAASEAVASPVPPQDEASPSATAQAATSRTNLGPAQVWEVTQPCNAVLLPESAQPLESAQQPHSPGPVPNNNQPQTLCRPSSIASESLAPPPDVADSDEGAAVSQSRISYSGLQNHNDTRSAPQSSSRTDALVVEGTASKAPVPVQHVAAPDSHLADLKPEQQALLVKGLRLTTQVCQVTTTPSSHQLCSLSKHAFLTPNMLTTPTSR